MRRALALALPLCLALLLPGPAPGQGIPAGWTAEWPRTDFDRAEVDLSEIREGGPGRDGIPALDGATFRPAAEETRIPPREPVVTLTLPGADPRAYPLRYLTWHEIVNDTVAGRPVAVTFCPLCNSAIVFDREVGDRTLTFGVTGKLRHSDMVMYDRETESWWQQATGAGIVGSFAGSDLDRLPVWVESFEAFRAAHPAGLVMEQPDWPRSYGANPYRGYDTSARPFLYDGEMPPHGIDPLARVVAVDGRAWPLERVRRSGEIAEDGLVITWRAGVASALDTPMIAGGRDVGAVRVRDAEGRDVAHDVMFAFAFHAFWPEGAWHLD